MKMGKAHIKQSLAPAGQSDVERVVLDGADKQHPPNNYSRSLIVGQPPGAAAPRRRRAAYGDKTITVIKLGHPSRYQSIKVLMYS